MVLHVFISLLGGVPLCIPYGLYSGTSLGGTTRGTLEGYPSRALSLRLSRNSTKFNVVTRFCETIPTLQSVSSSEI